MLPVFEGSTAVEGSFCCRLLVPQSSMASPGAGVLPLAFTYDVSVVTAPSPAVAAPALGEFAAMRAVATARAPAPERASRARCRVFVLLVLCMRVLPLEGAIGGSRQQLCAGGSADARNLPRSVGSGRPSTTGP